MKRALKIGIVALLVIVALTGGAFAFAVWLGEHKVERQVLGKGVPVPFANGPAALRQGRYLFETRGCISCDRTDTSSRKNHGGSHRQLLRLAHITRLSPTPV